MTLTPRQVMSRQWRAAWTSAVVAACALVSAAAAIAAAYARATAPTPIVYTSTRGVIVSSGVLIVLSGFQAQLARRQTERVAPDQLRAWMPWLSFGLYAVGAVCIGFGLVWGHKAL